MRIRAMLLLTVSTIAFASGHASVVLAQDTTIARIRRQFQQVDANRARLQRDRLGPEVVFGPHRDDDPSDPDSVTAYRDAVSVRELVLTIPGEDWQYQQELYFDSEGL